MAGSGFSERAWDQAYRAAVAQAFGTVPYYREMWAEAGARREDPAPTPVTRLEEVLAALYPLGAPYERRREEPGWIGEPAELLEALRLTGAYRGERPLFEVRRALLDWRRVGRARYHVVLSADAEAADPETRAAGLRALRAAREPALLGDPGQLAELPDHPGGARLLVRLPLTDPAVSEHGAHEHGAHEHGAHGQEVHGQEVHGQEVHGHVVHDGHLGYLGGRDRGCGRVHVNWRRVHVRQTPAGPLFTLLRRRRPTLVGISVPGTAHLAVERCARHGTPVLAAREAVAA
ncbi:hypothetical protein [Nonomuraea sp. NPDC050786]|uniref:hypothetical protein n=1 Tax=Nonomuraea sp. NPDC050786 TaxID=3154840 RepID=UPI0033D38B73